MNKVSYGNFEECMNQEKKKIRYPMDNNSLYHDQIYDNQTAYRRCYEKSHMNTMEGFSGNLTWDKILKVIIVILLILLFITLAKDFLMPPSQVNLAGGVLSASEFHLTAIPGFESL